MNLKQPTTKLGRISFSTTLIFIGLLILKFMPEMRIPLPTMILFGFEILSFLFGLIAIIKEKERSIWIWLPILIGTLVTIWSVAEILFPH